MNFIQEEDIIDKIKQEITTLHPIQNSKSDQKDYEIGIHVNFYHYHRITHGNPCTIINLTNGNNQFLGTLKEFKVNQYLSLEKLKELITSLLIEFPIASNLSIKNWSIFFTLEIPFEKRKKEEKSCIGILLEFCAHDNLSMEVIMNDFKSIIMNLYPKMIKTPDFQKEYELFCYRNHVSDNEKTKQHKLVKNK